MIIYGIKDPELTQLQDELVTYSSQFSDAQSESKIYLDFGWQDGDTYYIEDWMYQRVLSKFPIQSIFDTIFPSGMPLSQKTSDQIRFKKRAAVKDDILSSMAADNMERVRNGTWTAGELVSLTQDPELKNLLDDINTLSFEIAYSKVDGLTNSLLTQDIKDEWKLKYIQIFT